MSTLSTTRTTYDRRAIMADAIAQARAARSAAGTSGATKPARIPARDLLLTYRDDKGELTARTVRLRAVRRSGSGLLVEAHCRLRNAVRCFRADRVLALADLASGRVCPDPRAYLAGLEGMA